jgi:DNA-binding LytR/AlgR family response regulator
MKVKDQVDFISSSHDEVQVQNETFSSAHNPQLQPVKSPSYPMPFIFIKNGKMYERVSYSSFLYLQARGSYCEIMTITRKYTLSMSLSKVLEQIGCSTLLRCHRSYAVNKDRIVAFDEGNVRVEGKKDTVMLPISSSYRKGLVARLHRLKS